MIFFDGILLVFEGNLDASIGLINSWDGRTALHLLNEIEHVPGRLWAPHASSDDLLEARALSEKHPGKLLWNSSFIRELVCSVKGLDVGEFHSLPPRGKAD